MRESKGLMGLPAPRIGYDGVIQVNGQPVPVSDGVLQLGQQRLFVEDDGTVTNEQGKQVARVQGGKLMPLQQQQQAA